MELSGIKFNRMDYTRVAVVGFNLPIFIHIIDATNGTMLTSYEINNQFESISGSQQMYYTANNDIYIATRKASPDNLLAIILI